MDCRVDWTQVSAGAGQANEHHNPASAEFLFREGPQGDFLNTHPDSFDELLRIHEYERQRMGHELHDSAGQLLVSLQLSLAHLKIADDKCRHSIEIREIQDIVRRMDQEIRSLAFLQFPIELADLGLESVLASLARNFGRHTGIGTSFQVIGRMAIVQEAVSVVLLRVAQEAVANIHRHAHAAHSKIRLKWLATCVELVVSDDGIGMLAAAKEQEPGGIGLKGMRHRVESLGGRLELKSLRPGTRVSVMIPLAA